MGNTFMRIAAVSLIGVLMAGLSGCGGGSDPAPSTTPATTPAPDPETASPSQSPTPTEPPTVETVRPETDIPEPKKYDQMANDDMQGADAAARYFLDLYGYTYETGDLKSWNKKSGPDCAVCALVTEQVEEFYGRAAYRKRRWMIEPAFPRIDHNAAFTRFSRRGLSADTSEFHLVAAAHSTKTVFALSLY